MRDVLLGSISYFLSISALIAVMLICWHLFGPPNVDRARSFLFLGGGGLLTIAIVVVLIATAIIYDLALRA